MGVITGERIAIESAHGRIEAVAEADETMRPGVVSVTHGWGGLPGEAADGPGEGADTHGVNVNLLTTTRSGLDPINAMPCLTAIPVRIVALRQSFHR